MHVMAVVCASRVCAHIMARNNFIGLLQANVRGVKTDSTENRQYIRPKVVVPDNCL